VKNPYNNGKQIMHALQKQAKTSHAYCYCSNPWANYTPEIMHHFSKYANCRELSHGFAAELLKLLQMEVTSYILNRIQLLNAIQTFIFLRKAKLIHDASM
jgi:hypothetical protein